MEIKDIQNGDLLFMRDKSPLSQAIIKSTSQYSHVGIFFNSCIYHATKKRGVTKQDLSAYLKEEEREVFVYRYPQIEEKKVLEEAEKHIGKPYNHSFYPGEDAFYCSQYIAKILPLFSTIPMKFGDENNEVSDFWKEYYKELGVPVPLNLEGTNPNQLSQCEKLIFVDQLFY